MVFSSNQFAKQMYEENHYYQNQRSIIFRNYKEEVQEEAQEEVPEKVPEEVNVEWLGFSP